jgi:hypothetical protein
MEGKIDPAVLDGAVATAEAENEELEAVTEVVYFDPALDTVPQPDASEDNAETILIIKGKDSTLIILIGALTAAAFLLCMITYCIMIACKRSANPTSYETQKSPAATSSMQHV